MSNLDKVIKAMELAFTTGSGCVLTANDVAIVLGNIYEKKQIEALVFDEQFLVDFWNSEVRLETAEEIKSLPDEDFKQIETVLQWRLANHTDLYETWSEILHLTLAEVLG